MYRRKDPNQLVLDGFITPFGKLSATNRWVKQAELVPWDYIEEQYSKNFTQSSGSPAINSRIAFGAIYISQKAKLTDREVVEYIIENPYVQYFLGLNEYVDTPLFDASMMVHFRKRFPAEVINEINLRMHGKAAGMQCQAHSCEEESEAPDTNPPPTQTNPEIATEEPESVDILPNKGKLLLDATCAEADIRYPSDLSLLNEARENLEEMIDELWPLTKREGHKTAYSRKKARKGYLSIIKQKQPRNTKLRKEIRYQLSCVEKNITTISNILMRVGLEVLPEKRIMRLLVICQLHRQQSKMNSDNSRNCEDRIVSLRQPHIRPIARNKSGKRFEFGQKISTSVISGYTFIERQGYDPFNEGITLQESVERYRQRFGYYPEAVQADKLYRNRSNLQYCKRHGIRLSGPPLGRPRKKDTDHIRKLAYQDNCERNTIEGRYGIAKRRYGMARVLPYLPETGKTQVALQILCMNMDVRLRALASFIFSFFNCWIYRAFLNFAVG